jgi:hypothetical protein
VTPTRATRHADLSQATSYAHNGPVPIRPAVASPLAVCAAVATLLALNGCDLAERAEGWDGAPGEPAPTASHSPLTPVKPQAGAGPKAHTSTVTVDGITLHISSRKAADVQADDSGPGSTRTVTLSLAPGRSARLELASPGELDVDSDGSISVLDGNGAPIAAVSPPALPSDAGKDAPRIEVTDTDATHALLEVDARTRLGADPFPAEPLRVTFVVGTQAIEGASWGENEGGRSLAVDPTDWARHAGEAGLELIRTQLVAAEPDADTRTMEHQLVCHAVGAPDKATWNLEPWRPDVGLILTATAHCNPT